MRRRLALTAAIATTVAACAPDLTVGGGAGSATGGTTSSAGGGTGGTVTSGGGGTGGTHGGAVRWAQLANSTDDQLVHGVTVTGGEIYVAAENIGDSGIPHAEALRGQAEGFLSQYLDGSGPHRPLAIAHDPIGQVFVVGEMMGTTADPPTEDFPASAGGSDCFLARVSPTFEKVWRIGTAGYSSCRGVVAKGSGGTFVAGTFTGTLDMTLLSSLKVPVTSQGDHDVFVARIGATVDADVAWAFGDAGEQAARAMGADAAGNLYVLADDNGKASHGGFDLWLLQLAPDGHALGDRHYGTVDDDAALALGVAADGSTAIAGRMTTPLDLGGGALGGETFVAAFGPSGEHRWSHGITDEMGDVSIAALLFDDQGNTYVGGSFTAQMSLAGQSFAAVGASDGFVAKVRPSGAVEWVDTLANGQQSRVRGLAFGDDGSVIVAGELQGDLVVLGEVVLTDATGYDMFALSLEP